MKNNTYKKAYNLVNANLKILTDSDMSALVALSPAGLGKTTLVLKAMEEKGWKQGIHYLYYNSYFTPLGFYQVLQEATLLKEPKVLILDDVETILKDKNIINLLKSATWDSGNKRIVTYNSTSSRVKDTQCEFDGKIIILINETPDANPLFKTIIDRVLFIELDFTQEEILDLMAGEIIKKDYKGITLEKRKKILAFIKKNIQPASELSFRTLIKAYNAMIYTPNHWQPLVLELLKAKKEIKTVKKSKGLL